MLRCFILSRPLSVLSAAALLVSTAFSQQLHSTLISSGFSSPVYVTAAPGSSNRLFVVEQSGRIKIIKDGVTLATPFINLSSIIVSGGEQGLLGLAFSPSYATNGKFYVAYTDLNGASVVRQYLVSGNPDIANPAGFTTIFGPYPHPQSNHNGGNLQFGPDGFLYYGIGDGGNGNDTGAGHDPSTGNGQSLNTYLGKLLRIDVNNPPSYVPPGNPFGGSAFPLIWSYGLRNPWRWSFDKSTGDLYIGDVGQGAWEEVDFQSAGSAGGQNYGWRCMEGFHCTGLTGCTCNAANLVLPIVEYGHVNGQCSITGGYVYRGSSIPGLAGTYFYADYCAGRIWSFQYVGGQVTNAVDRTAELAPGGGHAIQNPTSFGQDNQGDLYIVDQDGEIYRIDGTCPSPTTYCVAAANSTGSGATMSFSGSGVIAQNNLQLACNGAPPTVNGLFFYGQGQTQVPMGNGFRCVGNPLHRLSVVQTNATGHAQFAFDVHAPPALITPGSTWNFQFYYRDAAAGGAFFNVSNGLSVLFCP